GEPSIGAPKPAEPKVHRHAANAWLVFTRDRDERLIGWAFPNAGAFATIRPERTFLDVLFDVPIGAVAIIEVHFSLHPNVGIDLLIVIYPFTRVQKLIMVVVGVHFPGES